MEKEEAVERWNKEVRERWRELGCASRFRGEWRRTREGRKREQDEDGNLNVSENSSRCLRLMNTEYIISTSYD